MQPNFFVPKNRLKDGANPVLRRLGTSWAVSPARRIIQTVCFIVFMALLCFVCWPYGGQDVGESFAAKEHLAAEIFLVLDPLVSLSAAIAARQWVWSLTGAAVILGVCLFLPRGFCAYVCPFGTVLDLFDWAIGRRVPSPGLRRWGGWANAKYAILAAVLLSALFGVLLSGFVAAIPVFTRAMVYLLDPLQTGVFRGWHQVPSMHAGHMVAIGLFLAILTLSLVEKRFWCKYLCPTGAVFSVTNWLRLNERKVATSCVQCGQCSQACDFAAIHDNYATRQTQCSFCQSCAGVCPVDAIHFAGRWCDVGQVVTGQAEAAIQSRRHVLAGLACGAAVGVGIPLAMGHAQNQASVVRAPGSVPEAAFLDLCVRCGQCMKVCPNHVLQPMGLSQGINGIWTPQVGGD